MDQKDTILKMAINTFEISATIKMDEAQTYTMLSTCNHLAGNTDKSENYILKAVELTPNDANVNLTAGQIFMQKQEFETALPYVKKAVELEVQYAHDVLPRGILGLNAEMFVDYMQYIGNRRLEGIGIDFRFDSDQNPFPWLSEVVDTGAMTNFFERKVKDYQSSGMLEDDF